MLTFVVPVKSKRVSSDWPMFCNLFERTLTSICNQTDKNFKVIAVCHEIPEINFTHENLQYINVNFEPPLPRGDESNQSLIKRREIDKGDKIKLGVAYAKEKFNTDYVMTVDSDDFISKRIAAYVNQSESNLPGWYVKKGYLFLEGKKFLFTTNKFNDLCGSCVIVKPEFIEHFYGVDAVFYFDHKLKVLNGDIMLSEFPFAGGIYSMANGDNHLMSSNSVKTLNNHSGWLSSEGINRLYTKFKNYNFKFITSKLRKEFSFYADTVKQN